MAHLLTRPESRNVEEVCRFPELPARKPLTYQAKQLIAREIEMEKMRRAEALARVGDSPQVSPPWGPEPGQGGQGRRKGPCPWTGPAQSALTTPFVCRWTGFPQGPRLHWGVPGTKRHSRPPHTATRGSG